jgi:chemotaxis methyl-accepting protein methylase
VTDAALDAVLAIVADRRGVDFRDYRRETLARGVRARVAHTAAGDLDRYRAQLDTSPDELDHLIQALLVPVTGFFRDPPVFAALGDRVLGDLVAAAPPGATLRAWAAGVATGEEGWSIAMLLARACELRPDAYMDVLCSDLDDRSLATARRGEYPAAAAEAVPMAVASRFVTVDGGVARVAPVLRDRVRFVRHDVMGRSLAPREAVIASFHLVLFRNVLIYFDRRLQHKALERLAGVLEPGGALVLGRVETMPDALTGRFEVYPGVPPDLRIFRAREAR